MYFWEDGTAGYFLKYKERGHPPLCAGMMNVGTLVMWHCHRKNGKHFICEEDRSPKEVTRTQSVTFRQHGLQPHEPSNSPANFTHIVCPSGHWTHEFMACDAQSACWQLDKLRQICQSDKRRAVTSFCQPPLSTLFTCRNDVEHVPYSLVCDHSQDCLDSSDEDFCVHPPCSGSELFECTNKQVGSLRERERLSYVLLTMKSLFMVHGFSLNIFHSFHVTLSGLTCFRSLCFVVCAVLKKPQLD